MNKSYHLEICRRALEDRFSSRALDVIIAANLGQDKLSGQIGHPEFHFDDNAFEVGHRYMQEQRALILDALARRDDPAPAWQAFGRLTHAGQDFYAHSNYLALWADSHAAGEIPAPSQVDALNPGLLSHPKLESGRIHLWDWLAYLPGLRGLARRVLPKNSHTHMNLDHPRQGALFPYAIEAAIQRTIQEYDAIAARIETKLGETLLHRFTDR